MKTTKYFALISVIFLIVILQSCKKDKCFDRQLYNQSKDNICTADCPGVTGCDGKFYCNECEANKQGIHVQR
jgi:hypothetical protein